MKLSTKLILAALGVATVFACLAGCMYVVSDLSLVACLKEAGLILLTAGTIVAYLRYLLSINFLRELRQVLVVTVTCFVLGLLILMSPILMLVRAWRRRRRKLSY